MWHASGNLIRHCDTIWVTNHQPNSNCDCSYSILALSYWISAADWQVHYNLFMTLSGMAVAFKASTSSSTRQHRLLPTKDQCEYGFTQLSGQKCRKRFAALRVTAISGKLDLDFTDPSWNQKYQQDWNRRFSLPHITDIYDLKPRRTTFSLKKNRFIPVCYLFLWLNWFWFLNRWTVAGSFDSNPLFFMTEFPWVTVMVMAHQLICGTVM